MVSAVMAQDVPFPLQTEESKGWEVVSTQVFEGSGLWGYIDGGADIYMEYGFEHVYVQLISWHDNLFKIESYAMTDPLAAFGIFSVNRYRCLTTDSIAVPHCLTAYQVSAVLGNYYVSVTNEAGIDLEPQDAIHLLQVVGEELGGDSLVFPEPFATKDKMEHMRCIRGKLGLMNGYSLWYDLFEPFTGYTLFIMPVPDEHSQLKLAWVDFLIPEHREELLRRFAANETGSGPVPDHILRSKKIEPSSLLLLIGKEHDLEIAAPYLELFGD